MVSAPVGHIHLTFKAYKEGEQWVSECVELGTASCGDSIEDAFDALNDATVLYLQAVEEAGETDRIFRERGIEVALGAPEVDGEEVSLRARPNEIVSPHALALPVRVA